MLREPAGQGAACRGVYFAANVFWCYVAGASAFFSEANTNAGLLYHLIYL